MSVLWILFNFKLTIIEYIQIIMSLLCFFGAISSICAQSIFSCRHKRIITFPPRLALGGFPALTTLAGPVDSVETHYDSRHYNMLCIHEHRLSKTNSNEWKEKQESDEMTKKRSRSNTEELVVLSQFCPFCLSLVFRLSYYSSYLPLVSRLFPQVSFAAATHKLPFFCPIIIVTM